MALATRPQCLKDYIGQEGCRGLVQAAIDKAKTGKQLGHILCFGPSGVGKSTLSHILGNECGYEWTSITASKEITPAVMRHTLLNLDARGYGPGGVWQSGAKRHLVFVDEVSQLSLAVWESVMFNAMEDCELNTTEGTFWLPDWTLFAATNEPYALPQAARNRFTYNLHLDPYTLDELVKIILRVYPHMAADVAAEVAQRSRGIARLALNYAEGVNDHGLDYFSACRVDSIGLTDLDHAYLAALESADGRPMSLNSIAQVVRESPKTLQTFVESELLRLGMIRVERTGRILNKPCRGGKIRE